MGEEWRREVRKVREEEKEGGEAIMKRKLEVKKNSGKKGQREWARGEDKSRRREERER